MLRTQKRGGGLVRARSTSLAARVNEQDDSPLIKSVFFGSLWGVAATMLSGAILITVMTAIAYANPDPSPLIAPMGLISLLLSSFIGGFVTAKRIKEAPLLCGIVCGGIITILTMSLGIILRGFPSSGYAFWQSAALHGAVIIFSVLGAFAGNVKKKHRSMSKRYR